MTPPFPVQDNPFDIVETPGFDDQESAGRWSTAPAPVVPWRSRVVKWIQKTFDAQDLLLFAGLVMLGIGFHAVYAPLGWIVPGALVVWQQMPQRPQFFRSPPVVRSDAAPFSMTVTGRDNDGRI